MKGPLTHTFLVQFNLVQRVRRCTPPSGNSSVCRNHNPTLSSFMTLKIYHRVYTKNNTTVTTSEAVTGYFPRLPDFTTVFSGVGVPESLVCFLCSALQIIVCPFVRFLLAIVLSVLHRFRASDYLFSMFKLFFNMIIDIVRYKSFQAILIVSLKLRFYLSFKNIKNKYTIQWYCIKLHMEAYCYLDIWLSLN